MDGEKWTAVQSKYPMKWHNFLIYFFLWWKMLIGFVGGLRMLGEMSAFDTELGYEILNIVFGALMCAYGAFCVVVRFALSRFKKGAPGMLMALLALEVLLPILYSVFAAGITGVPLGRFWADHRVAQVLLNLVVVGCNAAYYNRRGELFARGMKDEG